MNNIIKLIICVVFVFSSATCFAEWRKADDLDLPDNDFSSIDCEFVIPSKKHDTGFTISALESNIESGVSLRFNKDIIDFKIIVAQPVSAKSGYLIIQLLDDDRFLLCEHEVRLVGENYTGTIFYKTKSTWEFFKKIKYYRLCHKS